MKIFKPLVIILGVVFFIAVRFFIYHFIPIIGINLSSLFITDLVGRALVVPLWVIITSDFLNLALCWLVAEKFLGKGYGFFALFFYAISPWAAYLAIGGSIFILILFGILMFYFGLMLVKEDRKGIGITFSLLGLGIMIYSSFSVLLIIPLVLLGIYKSHIYRKTEGRAFVVLLAIILVPIVFLSATHIFSLKQVILKDITLFNEVGLINSVNTFRGEASASGFPVLGKVVENKITYFGRHVIFNTLTTLSPYTYFTPQFKLLGFSFTPPVFLGVLIPFLYGLAKIIEGKKKNAYLFFVTLPFLVPTVLRKYSPDLNSLVFILPAIIFVASLGIRKLIEDKKWAFIAIAAFLICLQAVTTLYDISTRDPIRYQKMVQTNQ